VQLTALELAERGIGEQKPRDQAFARCPA